ncbi:MAG: SpoIID/LytB domain-containing protein [Candidatus Zixiibacteriota bacterium]
MTTVGKWSLRLGMALFLMVLIWSCASVPGLKDELVTPVIRVPFVRVLIDQNNADVTLGGEGSFAVECLTGEQQAVYFSSRSVRVAVDGRKLRVEDNRGNPIQEGLDEVNLIPRGNNSPLRIDEKRYRGILKVLPYGQNIRVINVVYMEDYLKGVVPPEIGKRNENELEAIKAQAVAARTYAIAHLQQYVGEPFDVKSTVVDQLYEGMEVEDKLVNRGVEQTAGHVAMYQGDFISAYYHSTCGGMTDDIAEVWDKKELPYLQPVDDSAACSWSKYYTWQEVFTEKQLRGRIEQYLSGDRGRDIRIAPITDITVQSRTPGGRVERLVVRTETDVYHFNKDRIRWVIGRTSNPDLILPSDRFDALTEHDAAGRLNEVTIKGRGYGHGVGMCQCGAIGWSRTGWTYDQILKHYYAGIDLKKLY